MNEYYVYIYLNPTKPGRYVYGNYEFPYEPIYVGKGHGDRYLVHIRKVNWSNQPKYIEDFCTLLRDLKSKSLEPTIEFVEKNLSEEDAFAIEKKLIRSIGRQLNGSGPLFNKSSGGTGNYCVYGDALIRRNKSISKGRTGCRMPNRTEEQKIKTAESLRKAVSYRVKNVPEFTPSIIKFLEELPIIEPGIRNNTGKFWYIIFGINGSMIGIPRGGLNAFMKNSGISGEFNSLCEEFEKTGHIRFGRNKRMRKYSALRFSSLEELYTNLNKGKSAAKPENFLESSTTTERQRIITLNQVGYTQVSGSARLS